MNPDTAALAASVAIKVNDQPRTLTVGATLADVVTDLGLSDRKGIAAAVNGSVVPRREWAARGLLAGDAVLVIQATQGG
jgi:sulfur carrier protein